MTLTLLQGHTIKSELWKNGTKCDEETCFKVVGSPKLGLLMGANIPIDTESTSLRIFQRKLLCLGHVGVILVSSNVLIVARL